MFAKTPCTFSQTDTIFDCTIVTYCQTRVQTISRSTLDASQVLSNSISISDSGGLDLSRHCNCFVPPTQKTFWSLPEPYQTRLSRKSILSIYHFSITFFRPKGSLDLALMMMMSGLFLKQWFFFETLILLMFNPTNQIEFVSKLSKSSHIIAQHDEIFWEDYQYTKHSQFRHYYKFESGPFKSWQSISQHCEIPKLDAKHI